MTNTELILLKIIIHRLERFMVLIIFIYAFHLECVHVCIYMSVFETLLGLNSLYDPDIRFQALVNYP